MDVAGIKASTDAVLKQIPGLEGFVEDTRRKITDSVKEVVNEAMAGVADGVSQIAQLGYSVNGATITVKPSAELKITVAAEIPTFTAVVSMPLIPYQSGPETNEIKVNL